ncbi:hypothetical protein [Helicobacter sp. 11S02629-2]|uniref:hypothetical protein n=1 Tax=Helicobacter sp. 11S02629-2 TaxID=1476195 RepID=UPI000BA708CA|nr:hypothetical protein [Helicobacter sp. 11S02629-2]PAF44089.1 hypothetical protein BKH40_06365 [Helicobacter sp. 11S02629-2]
MDFFSKKKLSIINWEKDLSSFSKSTDINLQNCNIHISSIRTFFTNDMPVPAGYFDSEYENSDKEIYQKYDVEITPKEYDFNALDVRIDRNNLVATLTLKEGLFIDNTEVYKMQFIDCVLAKLVEQNVILHNSKILKAVLVHILNDFSENIVLTKALSVEILKSKASYKTRGLINLLEEAWVKKNHTEIIENALYAANEGEEIAIFLKDDEIINGRNLTGEYINMQSIYERESKDKDISSISPPNIDENIDKEENDKKIIYKAKTKGIVDYQDNLKIISIATFDTVSNKTGSILGGLEKGIEVDVECSDNSKDALQTNAIIEADVVNITGNVGENTIIKANNLNIKGQTHQSSIIYANEAFINIHKGTLYAKNEANVEYLELGRIYAQDANILQLNGGKVVAKRVVVSRLRNNCNIYFSEDVHLKLIDGVENKLEFNIMANIELKPHFLGILAKDTLLKEHIKSRVAYCKSLILKARKLKPVIETLKPLIAKSKAEATPLDSEVKKMLQYYAALLKQVHLQRDTAIKLQNDRIENATLATGLEGELLQAKITTESSWRDNNEIILHRFFPVEEKSSILLEDSDMLDIELDKDYKLQKISPE